MNKEKFVSKNTYNIPFSNIRKIFEKSRKLEMQGEKIIHMEIGRPDFDTPNNIKKEAIKSIEKGYVHYSSSKGILELRQAISEKLRKDNNINVTPEEVIVTSGCKEAIFDTLLAFLNPGEEVLIPDPSWLAYTHIVQLLGGIPIPVPLKSRNDFIIDPQDVKALITNKTKFLILCSPHNPTGAVIDSSTIQELANICIDENLLVLSDEIYEKLIYDDAQHLSIGSLPNMEERTITINGFSKAYAMDGWRLGYAAGSESLTKYIHKVHQYVTTCASTFNQYGAAEAYRGSQNKLNHMINEFNTRREFLIKEFSRIEGISCNTPLGSFYIFPKFHGYDLSSYEMALYLLHEANVACVPGQSFGINGKGHIRFSYATDFESIQTGMKSIRKALKKL